MTKIMVFRCPGKNEQNKGEWLFNPVITNCLMCNTVLSHPLLSIVFTVRL